MLKVYIGILVNSKKVSIIGNFFNATNIQVILLSFPYQKEVNIQFLLFDKLMDE